MNKNNVVVKNVKFSCVEDVKKFVSDSFETYFIHEDNVHISYKGIPKTLSTDKERMDYIDGLSIQNRLDLFKENLFFNESEYIFIYPIWGMFGVPSAYEEFVPIRNRFKNFAVILYI